MVSLWVGFVERLVGVGILLVVVVWCCDCLRSVFGLLVCCLGVMVVCFALFVFTSTCEFVGLLGLLLYWVICCVLG